MAGHGAPIFEHCIFSFVQSRELPSDHIVNLTKTIEDHAGKVLELKRDGRIKLEEVTHIFSTTSDFQQYSEARDNMINVIRPAWIDESLLKNKAAPTRPHTPDPNLYFSNVAISCADIPNGDKDAIIGSVLALGGSELNALTRSCTHLCALTMDHPKCVLAVEKKLRCKIVLPHWFDDCLKLGKRINEEPYLLPDPEILRAHPDDSLPLPVSDHIQGAQTTRPEHLPLSTDSPRRLHVFSSKTVMIAEDLQIGSRLRKVLEDLITEGDGKITNSVHSADMYVCQWRGGRDYTVAARAGKDVGNLSWLYHLITYNQWTSPMKRLLHYPLPPDGIPGFKNFKITVSNYGGDARTYLENLIIAAGAEFTKSMKEDNTHVITARDSGEKCKAAAEWDIEMINHLWIEESYAKCEILRLTDPRYTHFPPRTNLGEVIGQTPFDLKALRATYYPLSPTPSPTGPRSVKRPVMHEKDANSTNAPESEEEEEADISIENVNDEAEKPKVGRLKKAGLKACSKSAPTAKLNTPITNRRISVGKENDTPLSTGSRSAKNKALMNLHGLAPDIALYEKEKKRKGGPWGGERAANQLDRQITLDHSSSPAAKNHEDEYSEEDTPNAKRQRTSLDKKKGKAGPIAAEINLLVTNYAGWIGNPKKEADDKRKLRELGIVVVQDARRSTHLAAPNMVRTKKFLCALAMGPTIVHTDFIEACVKKGEVQDVESFQLKDTGNEKKFKLKLKDVIHRAKANKRSLLRRVPVYCTKDIPNGPDTYKDIVESNGGHFAVYSGKPVIKKVNPEEDETGPEPVYLLSGQKPAEKKLWPGFVAMAEDGNMVPRIVLTDWLLDVGMSQQLKWDDKYLVKMDE